MGPERSADADWLDGFIESLEAFRSFNRDVTVNQVLTFLYVARQPGITQTETLKLLGLATGGSSRIASSLSEHGARNGNAPGWNLLKLDENKNDRRFKNMSLTEHGVDFMNKVRECIRKSAEKIAINAHEK